MKLLWWGSRKCVPVMLSLLLMWTGSLAAQAPAGVLHGQVTDPSGAVVPGAAISLKSSSGLTVPAKSDGAGAYDIKGLAPGKYSVNVSAKGFTTSSLTVEIAAGQDKKLDVALDIATKEEEVVVESEGAKVSTNPDNNANTLVISGKDLDALSDDPDELQSELQALAGPSAGPNGGQIYIDGFTGGQLPPKSSIREIRINQNPFSAQYDRMGFGRIEILTKPGTDKLHGQFFFNDNHSIFDALNPFGSAEPNFSSEMLNGNVGGPLSKKASYFFNVERRDIHDAAVILGSAFTQAGQTPVGVLNPRIRTNLNARIDYQLFPSNTLMVRYHYTHNNEQNDGLGQQTLPSLAYNQTSDEHGIQVSDTQVLSAKAINETRFEWERGSTDQNSLVLAPTIRVLGAFTEGGNPLGISNSLSTHYEVQNYTSINLKTHFLRLGGRLRITDLATTTDKNFNGVYTFTSLAALKAGTPSELIVTQGNPQLENTFVDAGIYAEDDWKIRPNMTLSYGLRFETQNGISDHGDWAPRLGFAWGVDAKKNAPPKTIIRTGFGIFYDRFAQNLIMNAEQLNGLQKQFTFLEARPADQACLAQYPNPQASVCTGPFTTYQIDSKVRAPYTIQAVASVERQLTKASTLTVSYIHSRGVHQLLSINEAVVNAIQQGTYNPASPPPPAYEYVSEGVFDQNQMITSFRMSMGTKLSLFSYYALGHANGDTSGAGSFPSNPVLGITADYGRTAFDVRNRAFFGGTIALPRGFRISPFMVANSGPPFDITIGEDENGDSQFNDRPAFASVAPGAMASSCAAATPAAPVCTVPGLPAFNLFPGQNISRIPINFGTLPAQFTLNLRLSKTIGLGPKLETASNNQPQGGQRGSAGGPGGPGGGREGGPRGGAGGGPGGPMGGIFGGERSSQRYSLTFSANARNLFNNVNGGSPIGNLNAPLNSQGVSTFGSFTSLAGGVFNTQSANRRLDFQVMFSF